MSRLPRPINPTNIVYRRPLPCTTRLPRPHQQQGLASVRPIPGKPLPKAWFSASSPPKPLPQSSLWRTASSDGTGDNGKRVDERTLKLGKTIQILQDRMPILLHSPLPIEILSPSISLHLFPSTHPNLPTVRGRVAYIAALWTAPVAWGRLPGTNTHLEVLSEHMFKGAAPGQERLTVRWKTANSKIRKGDVKLGTTALADGEFSGIFYFEFDEAGRVASHTIENSEEDRGGEGASSVITVTEWLLRKAKGGMKEEGGLALQTQRHNEGNDNHQNRPKRDN